MNIEVLRNYCIAKRQYDNASINNNQNPSTDDAIFALFDVSCLDTVTGVNKLDMNKGSIVVYPNPGNGIFNLSINIDEINSGAEVEIYNVLGQYIFKKKITGYLKNQIVTFDLSNASDGLYLVQLVNGVNTYSQRIIKE